MALLTLDQARPGMTLAADVLDRRGHILIPSGHELTGRHLSAMRMWGVLQLEVEGDSPETDLEEPISPDAMAQAELETSDHFLNATPSHPFLDALREVSRNRRAREIAREAAG